MGAGELVTPRGNTRLRRHTVFAHTAYFEQFAKRFGSALARTGIGRQLARAGASESQSADTSSGSGSGLADASDRASVYRPPFAPRGHPVMRITETDDGHDADDESLDA